MNLAEVRQGKTYRISLVVDASLLERLNELGVFSGDKVSVRMVAPSGCPMVFSFGHLTLSLRKENASRILVTEEIEEESK